MSLEGDIIVPNTGGAIKETTEIQAQLLHCIVYCAFSQSDSALATSDRGSNSGEPHTSVTALHMRVCIYACLGNWADHLL